MYNGLVVIVVFCGNIAVSSYSDTRVNLKGIITGLEASKRYCIHYMDWGEKNLPNRSLQYTYIINTTSYDLASHGCYVPRSAWGDGDQMDIRCNEIGSNCEDIIKNVCAQVLKLEVSQDQYVHYVVEDNNGDPVSNARVECYGDTLYTGSDGKASHILNESPYRYYATCYAPNGYTCDDCNESFYVNGTEIINFTLVKDVTQRDCIIYFALLEVTGKGFISGVTCRVGNKTATTGSDGTCGITVPCGQTYTATCDIPEGYTCSCSGCKCSDTFTPQYPGGSVDTFYLKENVEEPTNCQQEFKVVDQNGNPVKGVYLEAEDQSNYNTFAIDGGGSRIGTQTDGTITTLQTLSGVNYKFYVSVYPAGYDYDVSGLSIIEKTACSGVITFRIKKLITDCMVNFCVRSQTGANVPGVVIHLDNDIGSITTRNNVDCFGCTGAIGLQCGLEYRGYINSTDAYDCTVCSKTFIPKTSTEPMVIYFDITDKLVDPPDPGDEYLVITPPSLNPVQYQNFDIGVSYIANQEVSIRQKGILDKTLGSGTTDGDGNCVVICNTDDYGDIEIYGCHPSILGCSKKSIIYQITIDQSDEPAPDDPTEGNFKIDAPSIVISETEFTVSGIHPNAGQEIDIMAKKSLTDDVIGSGVVDADGEFEIECIIDDFGFETIYAYDKTWLESWWLLDYIPAGWVVGNGASSNEKFVITISWSIIIMLVLMIALVLEKQYGYIGIFKR